MKSRHPMLHTARIAAMLALIGTTIRTAHAGNGNDYESRQVRTSRSHSSVEGQIVDVQIRVNGGNTPLYYRPGQFDRHYFQAFKGRDYSLVLRNTTSRRIGVLIAVDGLNVVNGEKSDLRRGEPMYVLDPYEQTEIRGWRTSLDDIRKFVFVDEERSYAERTGQANGDMGWIRVMAFRENVPAWTPRGGKVRERSFDGDMRGEAGAPAPMASDRAKAAPESRNEAFGQREDSQSNPGTGWGERSHDPVRQTHFEAERRAADQIALRYEYASGLNALGIYPTRFRVWERENGQLGFAKPPRW